MTGSDRNRSPHAIIVLREHDHLDSARQYNRIRDALRDRLIEAGVVASAIEIQDWSGTSGTDTGPAVKALMNRVVAGEVNFVAVRNRSRLGRFADARIDFYLEQALVLNGACLVTLDDEIDWSQDRRSRVASLC
jgi:hypothetical protein